MSGLGEALIEAKKLGKKIRYGKTERDLLDQLHKWGKFSFTYGQIRGGHSPHSKLISVGSRKWKAAVKLAQRNEISLHVNHRSDQGETYYDVIVRKFDGTPIRATSSRRGALGRDSFISHMKRLKAQLTIR